MKGKITAIEDKFEIDFSKEVIGDCWVPRSAKTTKQYSRCFAGERLILNPLKDNVNSKVLVEYLVKMIDDAENIVCMSSFLIQESDVTKALLRAAESGVRVYILTARDEDLKKAPEQLMEDEMPRIEEHRKLLNDMAGKVLVRTAPDFHAKFILADPFEETGKGVLMTCNATVGAMTGDNVETAMVLTRDEVKSLFAQFVFGFWKMADRQLTAPGKLDVKGDTPKVEFGEIQHPATTDEVRSLKNKIGEMIDSARVSIIVSAWSFDEQWTERLKIALDGGVKVTIYTRLSTWNTKSLISLVRAGAVVLSMGRMHAKSIIVDNKKGLIMTANFTALGLDTGFEAAVELEEGEVKGFVEQITKGWDAMCDRELKSGVTLGNASGKLLVYRPGNKDLDEMTVEDSDRREITYTPNSVEEMIGYKPKIGDENKGSVRYKKITYHYKVIPPTLPKDATKVENKESHLELYKKKNQYYAVIDSWEMLDKAKSNNKFNAMIVTLS